jgi:hypothetical protein
MKANMKYVTKYHLVELTTKGTAFKLSLDGEVIATIEPCTLWDTVVRGVATMEEKSRKEGNVGLHRRSEQSICMCETANEQAEASVHILAKEKRND